MHKGGGVEWAGAGGGGQDSLAVVHDGVFVVHQILSVAFVHLEVFFFPFKNRSELSTRIRTDRSVEFHWRTRSNRFTFELFYTSLCFFISEYLPNTVLYGGFRGSHLVRCSATVCR